VREGLENETRGRLTIRCPCKGSDRRVVEEGTVHIAAIAVPHLCDQELTLSLFAATRFHCMKTGKKDLETRPLVTSVNLWRVTTHKLSTTPIFPPCISCLLLQR